MKKIPDDPRFRYVSYKHTDLRKTFARIRREQAEAEVKAKAEAKVVKLKK